jgi:hydrogenase/urease accessory protein HupE
MTRSGFVFLTLTVLWVAGAGVADADVAFPARLSLEEAEPGTYEVVFTLPIVEGRKLRAEPLLPPTCRDLTEREIGVSAGGHTTTWTVTCKPHSLAGEAVLIQGLLGTQTDLAFTLTTLDGRVYTGILRPSRPGFLVPSPPSPWTLGGLAVVEGMRRVLRQLPMWLLIMVAVAGGARPRGLLAGALAFAVAHTVAQWLGGNGWLLVNPLVRDGFALWSAAVPAVALAGGGERWRGWLHPLWPVAVLLGLLYGGAQPEALPPDGLSSVEQLLGLGLFGVGVGAGLVLISLAATELRVVLTVAGGGRGWPSATRVIGYAVGIIATGMVLARLAAFGLLAGEVQRAPIELVMLALALGPSLAVAGLGKGRALATFVGLAALGLIPGLLGMLLPLAGVLVTGSLLLFGTALATDRPLPTRWIAVVGVVGVVGHSWSTGLELLENVSKSTGAATGAVLAASCVLFAGRAAARGLSPSAPLPVWVRFVGAGVAAAAVLWRLADYRVWWDTRVATEAALGLARIPIAALLLVIAALIAWPRRGRVLKELGVAHRPRAAHWLLLGAAFLLLPIGTAAVRNPFFEPHAPRGEDARRVVANVLSETYHAFNLVDEDELYDTLADNVIGDLVDDLYLDSRRRLTAGTREGAEVTVRDVSVLDIGDPLDLVEAGPMFAYDCRWVVTARVRHLQHVHHRQNIYNGMLTLQIDGDRWKIAGVELTSEDRVVLPWKPT